jgi:hypothetical protein
MPGLDRFQLDLLREFFSRQQGFFLTGGAALVGFHLGHRRTQDLDLFTTGDLLDEGESALYESADALGASVERLRTSMHFRRFLLSRGDESVVIDLARDLAPQVDCDKLELGGIRVDPSREIMANKLCALLSRAELRDLVDVRALEQAGHRLEDHLPLAMLKDGGLTAAELAWALSQLEIGDDASPPAGVSVGELRTYLGALIRRLTELAYPADPQAP